MTFYPKIFVLIVGLFCYLSPDKCYSQMYDSSVVIDAALGLYHELPSGTLFTKDEDSYAKQLRLKKVLQRCYQNNTLKTNKITKYNRDGTISNVITKFKEDSDSLVLTIEKSSKNYFEFSFSFPFEAIKDTMNFGFAEVIGSIGLNEKRYNLKVGLQIIDSVIAENFTVSINDRFIENRSRINLYPFLVPYIPDLNASPIPNGWDTTFENGFMILTKINSYPSGHSLKSINYLNLNNGKLKKFETYSNRKNDEWKLSVVQNYYYDSLGRKYKVVNTEPGNEIGTSIDSILYYPNGSVRSRSIYSPNNNLIVKDSLFAEDGKLVYEHMYGRDYSWVGDSIKMSHFDTFFTYNSIGLIINVRRFYNGDLVYSEEYEYDFWDN